MANYDFKPDLRDGQQGQNVMKFFLESYFCLKCLGQGDTSAFDLKMRDEAEGKTHLYEVKTDLYEKDYSKGTGNLVLEYECRGKRSGIQTSEADYYMWYLPLLDRDQIWMAPMENLLFGIGKKAWRVQPIGEYSIRTGEKSGLAYMIPRYDYKYLFKVYSTDNRGNFWPS
jgi:hypothetical protein|tara:strand:- start:4429 stop:4938 length:510 start_codon:yes stop_codon:yes gene_type:complete